MSKEGRRQKHWRGQGYGCRLDRARMDWDSLRYLHFIASISEHGKNITRLELIDLHKN